MLDARSAARCGSALALLVLFLAVGPVFAAGQLNISIPTGGSRHADGLNISYRLGDPLPAVITASVTSNLGTVPFTFSSSASWLQVTASQATTPATLQIQVNPAGLTVGTYTGTLTVITTISEGGRIYDWTDRSTITLTVTAPPPSTPAVVPTSLSFTGAVGQPIAPKSILLTSSPTSLPFVATSAQSWIGLSPASGVTGTSGASLSVSINTSSLPAGTSTGQIDVSLPGGTPATLSIPVSVTLTIAASTFQPPTPNLTGTAQQGASSVLLGSFSPVGTSTASLAFNVAVPPSAASWLSVTPSSGTTPAVVQVFANPQNLTPGPYSANLAVTLVNGDPAGYSVPVSFSVTAPPPVVFAVSLGAFDLNISTANPVSNTVPVTVSATQGSSPASAAFTVSTNQPWLKAVPTGGTTPSTIAISADASASPLAPGTYNGTVSISNEGVVRTNIQVSLTVATAGIAVFSSQQLEFTAQAGASSSASGAVAVNVTTTSTTPVDYKVTSNAPWIKITGYQIGTVTNTAYYTLGIDVNATSLSAGQVTGSITVTTVNAAGTVLGTDVANVKLNVTAPPAEVAVDRNLIRLDVVSGAAASQPASFGVTTATGTTAFTATTSTTWLSVTPTSGTGSQNITITVTPAQLGPGSYSGLITIAGPTSQATVNVQLNVVAPGALPFSLSPATVSLTTQSNVSQPASTVVSLSGLSETVLGNSVYQWSTSVQTAAGGQWLSASVNTSGFPFTLNISANPALLPVGTYTGTVSVYEQAGTTIQRDIPVTFTIQAPQLNSYASSVQTISEQAFTGAATPVRVAVGLAPKLAGLGFTTQVTMDSGAGWLSVANATGATMPATLEVVLNPASLTAGLYSGRVTFTATAGAGVVLENAVQSIPVQFVVVDPPQPQITVLNSAPVSFTLTAGSSSVNPTVAPLVTLGYTSTGTGSASVVSSSSWLRFNASSYNVSSAGITVFGYIDTGTAPSVPGTYSANYTINGPNGKVTDGSVTLLVTAGAPSIAVSPDASTITTGAGSFNLAGSAITIKNTGTSTFTFGVGTTSTGNWLGIGNGVNGGTLAPNQSAQIVPQAVGPLASGNYFGTVTVIASNGTANIQATHQVVLQVQPASIAGIHVDSAEPKSGPADGSNLTYSLTITNPSSQTLPFVVTSTSLTASSGGLGALAISPDTGNIAANSSRTISITGTAPSQSGLYGNAILFYINGIAFERDVIYSAVAASGPTCTVTRLIPLIQQPTPGASLSGSLPAVISAAVSDNCGNPLTGGTVTASFSNGDQVVALQSPAANGIWQGTWVPTSGADAEVTITLSVQDSTGAVQASAQRTVFIAATAGVPTVDKGGIVNGSDFSKPNIAQSGSYLSISGQNLASGDFAADNLPTQLGDTQVFLAETALGLSSVSPTHITAFVPFGLPINFSLPLQVVRGTSASVPQSIYITDKNPALFSSASPDAARAGVFTVTRAGSTFTVSTATPAKAGDLLTATATGLGWTADDGTVTGGVVLTIGGVSIVPSSAVLSPVLLGVYTVQATIPTGIAPGSQVPVTISVDGQASKAVTIAIQ